jgi:hypothetical protein
MAEPKRKLNYALYIPKARLTSSFEWTLGGPHCGLAEPFINQVGESFAEWVLESSPNHFWPLQFDEKQTHVLINEWLASQMQQNHTKILRQLGGAGRALGF